MSIVEDIISFIKQPSDIKTRDELAVRLFNDQCEAIPQYGRFAKNNKVHGIEDIPAVAETIYKEIRLRRNGRIVRTFRSSGTSGGPRTVIELSEAGLELMNTAIISSAGRHLFQDNIKTRFMLLVPSTETAPDIIMSYGMDIIGRHFGYDTPISYISSGKIDFDGLTQALTNAVSDNIPVTIAGGSFAFVHFSEYCKEKRWRISLAEGSRIVDAGGFKGKSRVINPYDMRKTLEEILGIADNRQTNILGMTELASQFYDTNRFIYIDGIKGSRVKKNDLWTDTKVIDPDTGQTTLDIGMLRHVDMAVYDRPCSLLTADLGISIGDGFSFLRRAASLQIRGCALTY